MLQFLENLCDFVGYLLKEKKNKVINKTLTNIVRYELASGKKVEGKFHLEEAIPGVNLQGLKHLAYEIMVEYEL